MKYITLHGMRFCRDDKSGYYRNGTHQKLAHRHVWEQVRGPIPSGWHIHHIDRDRSNNDVANLMCLSEQDHRDLHIREDGCFELRQKRAAWFASIRPKAKEWHSSPDGLAWHRSHAIEASFGSGPLRSVVCAACGGKFETVKRAKNVAFCSNKCRAAARRASKADHVEKACGHCSAVFSSCKHQKVRFCSKSCSNKARNSIAAMNAGMARR